MTLRPANPGHCQGGRQAGGSHPRPEPPVGQGSTQGSVGRTQQGRGGALPSERHGLEGPQASGHCGQRPAASLRARHHRDPDDPPENCRSPGGRNVQTPGKDRAPAGGSRGHRQGSAIRLSTEPEAPGPADPALTRESSESTVCPAGPGQPSRARATEATAVESGLQADSGEVGAVTCWPPPTRGGTDPAAGSPAHTGGGVSYSPTPHAPCPVQAPSPVAASSRPAARRAGGGCWEPSTPPPARGRPQWPHQRRPGQHRRPQRVGLQGSLVM